MSSTPRFFTLDNPTRTHALGVLIRLLWKALKPSMRAFAWRSTNRPIGSPLRPSDALLALCFYSDQSGFELLAGPRTFCFGVEPKRAITRSEPECAALLSSFAESFTNPEEDDRNAAPLSIPAAPTQASAMPA